MLKKPLMSTVNIAQRRNILGLLKLVTGSGKN